MANCSPKTYSTSLPNNFLDSRHRDKQKWVSRQAVTENKENAIETGEQEDNISETGAKQNNEF